MYMYISPWIKQPRVSAHINVVDFCFSIRFRMKAVQELREVEVAVLGSPSLISLMVFVDTKQH